MMSRAVRDFGVRHTFARISGNILTNKTILAQSGGRKARTRGCSQEGVISLLQWNFVVDELLANLELAGFSVKSYADEMAIIAVGCNLETLALRMQRAMNVVEDWCQS